MQGKSEVEAESGVSIETAGHPDRQQKARTIKVGID